MFCLTEVPIVVLDLQLVCSSKIETTTYGTFLRQLLMDIGLSTFSSPLSFDCGKRILRLSCDFDSKSYVRAFLLFLFFKKENDFCGEKNVIPIKKPFLIL
jgi:hypothetical protein